MVQDVTENSLTDQTVKADELTLHCFAYMDDLLLFVPTNDKLLLKGEHLTDQLE